MNGWMIFGGVIVLYIAMEGVAWLSHRYLMHGMLWIWHKDHHQKDPSSFFELNDLFFIIYAVPSAILIICGLAYNLAFGLGAGFGIALYGITYFLVHDVFIHKRIRIKLPFMGWYFKAVYRAHLAHHGTLTKEGAEYFGLLYIPRKFFRFKRHG